MEFRCIPDDLSAALASWQGDSLAVGLFASDGSNPPEPSRQWLENLLGPGLNERLEQRRFKAKPGEILPIERLGATPQTLILVGLGEASRFDLSALRQAAAAAAQAASRLGARELGLALPGAGLPAHAGCGRPAARPGLPTWLPRRSAFPRRLRLWSRWKSAGSRPG